MKDIISTFDSLPFLQLEDAGTFGRHYRFKGTKYKVVLYTKYSDRPSLPRFSYHKEMSWEKDYNIQSSNSSPEGRTIRAWFNSSFQEIFESCDQELREQLVWHLDIFK